MLPIVLFYGLISGVFAFGKQAILHVQPFFLSSSRLPFAGLTILGYQYIFKRHQIYYERACIFFLCLYGITLFIGDAFRFMAMVTIPAANSALVSATGPFVTAISAHFLLKEYLTVRKLLALVLGFLSIIPLIINNLSAIPEDQSIHQVLWGYGASFISVLGFVASAYALKVLTNRLKYPPLTAAGIGTIIGGIVGLGVSWIYEVWTPFPITNMHDAFPYLLLLFIGHNVIGYPIFAYLINKYPVTLVSFGQLTLPLFTALLRYCIFGDPIPWIFGFSLVVLAGAFYIFYTETKKQDSVL